MAVLVNFSKIISGVFIDFFQILMLTFVNGFKNAIGGNFISAFHIYEMLAMAQGTVVQGQPQIDSTPSNFALIGGLALAAVGITVVAMIVLIMIVTLIFRMVMLWLLIVLSPLAYFSYTISPKYWSQWWSEFFKHLISGPAIAFFLWLALLTAQQTGPEALLTTRDGTSLTNAIVVSEDANFLLSGFAVPSVMMSYLTMTTLMVAGLVVSQKMAEQSGSAAGKFAQGVRSKGAKAMKVGTGAFIGTKAYGWGSSRVKKFQKMREDIREEKSSRGAAKMMRGYGALKQGTIGRAGKFGSKLAGKLVDQDAIKEKRTDIGKKREEIEIAKRNGQDTTKLQGELQTLEGDLRGLTGGFKGYTSRGLQAVLNKPAQAGKREQESAYKYRLNQINSFKAQTEGRGYEENLATFDDETANKDERVMSVMQAIKQGAVASDDVGHIRDRVSNLVGNDPASMQQFDAVVAEALPSVANRQPIDKKTEKSYLEGLLKRDLKRVTDLSSTDLNDSAALLRGFTNEDSPGNLRVDRFLESAKGLPNAKRNIVIDGMKLAIEGADDSTTEGKQTRDKALQALFAMGAVDDFDTAANGKGMGDKEKADIMSAVFGQDQDMTVKNIIENSGKMSVQQALSLKKAKTTGGKPIMAPAKIDAMVSKVVYKQNQDTDKSTGGYPDAQQNHQKWLLQVKEMIDAAKSLTGTAKDDALKEAAKAASMIVQNAGEVKVLENPDMAPIRNQLVEEVADGMSNPNAVANIRWNEAKNVNSIRDVLMKALEMGTFGASEAVSADNKRAIDNVAPMQIDPLFEQIGRVYKPKSGDSKPTKAAKDAAQRVLENLEKRTDVSDVYARSGAPAKPKTKKKTP